MSHHSSVRTTRGLEGAIRLFRKESDSSNLVLSAYFLTVRPASVGTKELLRERPNGLVPCMGLDHLLVFCVDGYLTNFVHGIITRAAHY